MIDCGSGLVASPTFGRDVSTGLPAAGRAGSDLGSAAVAHRPGATAERSGAVRWWEETPKVTLGLG